MDMKTEQLHGGFHVKNSTNHKRSLAGLLLAGLLVASAGGMVLLALVWLLLVNPVLAFADRNEARVDTADPPRRVRQRR